MYSIASVVMSNSTRDFDREYSYMIPESMKGEVMPGIRVVVPFGKGNRTLEGYVTGVFEACEAGPLKSIKMVLDKVPVLKEEMLKLCSFMKRRYICTYSDAIKCMLPPGIGVKSTRVIRLLKCENSSKPTVNRILEALADSGNECEYEELKAKINSKGFGKYIRTMEEAGLVELKEEFTARVKEKYVRVAYLALPAEEIIDEIESNRIKKIQQIRVLEMLIDNEYISVSDLARFSGVSPGVLDTLRKYGYIDYKDIEVSRDPYRHADFKKTVPLVPTREQAAVLEYIYGSLDKQSFSEILLHGVTGSGKTEVYMQLIQRCIDSGRNTIILVPEISLTPQMVERFKGRFGDEVAVLHSRLSLGERYDQWRLINEGKIKVAVGARSAVFAPFAKLGMIVIDEEHETTYKSEITPKYHARDIARERCKNANAILLLGSATPSVETYYRAGQGEISLLNMRERTNNMLMPGTEIVDMRNELEEGNRTIFSRRLREEMTRNIETRQQTILFLNRRGYSSFVLCRNCGLVIRCVNCNISMTYHAHDERLICHYCGYTVKMPDKCPKCKSEHIRHFGTGTQKVEEDTRKQFPESTVIRMDMDTTSYKNSHENILRSFREENIDIMIGTQMIAKGHDFPNVTLVGILAADSLLNMEDYKASERTFQLVTQVAGRAGRGQLPGRVIIQTYNTEDFSILSACRHDYISFYNQEIRLREKLNYPPFTNVASLVLSGTNDRHVFEKARELKTLLCSSFAECWDEVSVLGPARSPLAKIKCKYRWRIIIKCRDLDKLIDVLASVSDGFYRKKGRDGTELGMDINPVNML